MRYGEVRCDVVKANRKEFMVHVAIDKITNKELAKVSKESGLSKTELSRYAVNMMFNPEWKRVTKEFDERFYEIFKLESPCGGGSSAGS